MTIIVENKSTKTVLMEVARLLRQLAEGDIVIQRKRAASNTADRITNIANSHDVGILLDYLE